MTDPTQPDDDPDDGATDPAQTIYQQSGPKRESMTSDYLPESDDWLAKTILDTNDPARIAALRNMGQIYPEVDDLQGLVDGVLDEYLRGKVSVNGASRDEFRKILMSMFGQSDDDDTSTGMKLVAADDD